MKINENQKVTLTIGQLKKLIKEGRFSRFPKNQDELNSARSNAKISKCLEAMKKVESFKEDYDELAKLIYENPKGEIGEVLSNHDNLYIEDYFSFTDFNANVGNTGICWEWDDHHAEPFVLVGSGVKLSNDEYDEEAGTALVSAVQYRSNTGEWTLVWRLGGDEEKYISETDDKAFVDAVMKELSDKDPERLEAFVEALCKLADEIDRELGRIEDELTEVTTITEGRFAKFIHKQ